MESVVSRQSLESVYRNKRVFVTGHTGFKGVWLTAMLKQLGAVVKGYALAPEDSAPFFNLFSAKPLTESVIADIRDKERLQSELISFQPDFIFHLAAQPLVLRSYELPAETFEVNVVGTANLLEAARLLKQPCAIVVITTDKVYENIEQHVLYQEGDRLGGHDPYSASKACTEIVVSSFRNSFFSQSRFEQHQVSIATARAGNVIGGGDWSTNRILPDTAKALLAGVPVIVRNPAAVRPWQHVLEPLSGYLLLGSKLVAEPAKYSTAFNFGPRPEDHLTVKELVELAVRIWGTGSIEMGKLTGQPHEANLLKLDIRRALDELGWDPKLNGEEAIRWTIEWYKKDEAEQAKYTFAQIDKYLGS